MPVKLSPGRCIAPFVPWFVAAVAPALANAQQDEIRYTPDIYPGDYHIERGAQRWQAHRIVDDLTGKPIAGAEVFYLMESETPLAGQFWFTRKVVSDAEGFVRICDDDMVCDRQVLRAPGYGVCSRSHPGGPIWRVGAAFDVPVLVRDELGRPVPGATIGLCGGCGHTPDLANATAGPDGIAWLRGIDPHNDIADLYAQHPGLGLGYQGLRWQPGDPPFLFDCPHAEAMTGTVLDHQDKPMAGVFVGAPDVHRGPWTKTRADGTFTLLGAPPGYSPQVNVPVPHDGKTRPRGRTVVFPEARSYPATLRLPDLSDPEAHQGKLEPAGETEPPTLVPVRVRIEGAAPDDVEVRYARQRRRDAGTDAGTVAVPAEGPFALVVDGRYHVFADRSALPKEPVVLAAFAPTRVTARVVDGSGAPVAVRARLLEDPEPEAVAFADGKVDLAVSATGLRLCELVPERGDLRPRRCWVALPHRGDDARVDLGVIALGSAPQLVVLGADGKPPACKVEFARTGYQTAGEYRSWPLDATGGWLGCDLRAGDAIVVTPTLAEGEPQVAGVPFRTVLAGAGPWRIEPPTGVLELTVCDPAGKELAAQALLADEVFEVQGRLALHGLPAGRHVLHVTAAGRQTAIVATTVPASGTKVLRVTLPAL